LPSDPLINVNDLNGLFTFDELTRVHGDVDALVEPCFGWVTEKTDSTTADEAVAFG
jgi:hypothetical protein